MLNYNEGKLEWWLKEILQKMNKKPVFYSFVTFCERHSSFDFRNLYVAKIRKNKLNQN